MTIRNSLSLGILLAWLPSHALAWGDNCKYTEEREAKLNAGDLSELHVSAGAGTLSIKGEVGRSEIEARATVCASDESLLRDSELRTRVDGGRAYVKTSLAEADSWTGRGYVSMDLVLWVPAALALDVRDSSGELEISNVAALALDDSSGSILVEDIGGDLSIEDSSGSLDVERVTGSVTINDSSGSIDVNDVSGSVLIERDSSGSIEVARIGGDFTVERDGSGGIRYRDVVGQVDIPRRKRDRD